MPEAPETPNRPLLSRLIVLTLVVLAGLGLFFALGRETPAVVAPALVEPAP